MTEIVLNQGLALAMEWGENWLQPIQERLAKTAPALSMSDLDQVNEICQQAMRRGHELAANPCTFFGIEPPIFERDRLKAKASEEKFRQLREDFRRTMREEYPWINDDNLGKLFSQGVYYGMK